MTQDSPPVCDYEGSDYQTRFWDEGNREYEDAVEAIALRRLLPAGGRRLLELGAGAGRNTPRYAGFDQVVLVDFSRSQLQQAQARLGKTERYLYVAADIYRLPFNPAQFDAATMIRTLHHMADAPRAIEQTGRALQTGGVFILEYANKRHLKSILRYILGRQKWSPFTLEPEEFVALNFDFHPKAVRSWLKGCGFAVERQITVSHFRAPLFKRVFPLKLLTGLDALAQYTGNWWQLTPSVFVRARLDRPVPDAAPVASLFACPACGNASLNEEPEALVCSGCGRRWPVEDGIYDFRGK
ncbi:MAG: methyltransferase domain-containing protein [Chloroflexi bacterium]|nr:methyltransferase domain-containing protein [Chloroflexota bacterium]